MKRTIASIAGLFLVAACSTTPTNEEQMSLTVALAQLQDAEMIAGCQGEIGRGGALSYSKKDDIYTLSTLKDNKVTVTLTPNSEGEGQRQFAKLNAHCYPA